MELRTFAIVFGTVFLAELGDKTQLATLLFASKNVPALATVFIAASLALIVATGIAVVGGALVAKYLDPRLLSYAAGVAFILIGAWTIWQASN